MNREESLTLGAEDQLVISRAGSTPLTSRNWFLFALVIVLSALYMAHELKHGWVPSDDGALAESADRVLHGALPHRDYHEIYTGLLSDLNALAFRALGINLASMRYVFFIFCLLWVSAFYYAASRLVSGPSAAAVALLAVAWGPPNWPTPMASWYNLFFATFGLASLLRFIDTEKRRWLIIAGLCGGISALFKMTGLYFVAGVLLFLAFREQVRTASPTRPKGNALYRVFLVLSLLSYEALLFALLSEQANAATYLYFWLPNLAIGAMIIWHELREDKCPSRRFSSLFCELSLFGAGVALPIAIFLLPYVLTGTLTTFFADLLIQPRGMISVGSVKPSVHRLIEGSLLCLLLIGFGSLTRSRTQSKLWETLLLGTPMALLIPAFLMLARQQTGFYQMAWSAAWIMAPFAVVVGVWLLGHWTDLNRVGSLHPQRLLLVLAVTAACSLIQYPFTIAVYYCFVAPLALLSAAAVVSLVEHPPRLAIAGMICFFILYATFELTPGYMYRLGLEYAPDTQIARLSVARGGGLMTVPSIAREYVELGTLIRQHAHGEYILAAPNCPQVYFLSDLRSPVRDFFSFSDDSLQRPEGVLANLEEHHVNLVVLNHLNSTFVQPVPTDLHAALVREFPNHAETEWFEVRWRQ